MQKVVKNNIIYVDKPKSNILPVLLSGVSLFLILLGAASLFFLQQPLLDQSFDTRRQASVETGLVTVETHLTSGTEFTSGNPVTIDLKAQTHRAQVDNLHLVFNVLSKSDELLIDVATTSGLVATSQEVEKTADGHLVSMTLTPRENTQPFSTLIPMTFATLSLKPSEASKVELHFDKEKSYSHLHGTTPPKDELQAIAAATYNIGNVADLQPISKVLDKNASPEPSSPLSHIYISDIPTYDAVRYTLTNTTQQVATSSATPSATPTPTPTTVPTSSPTPTLAATATPTTTPIVVYQTTNRVVKTCNQSCSTNAECDVNLRCFNGQCRRATFVSSPTCDNPPDQGLNRKCSEYCADTRECSAGLTCFNNRCKRPDAPDSSSCDVPTVTVSQSMAKSCNTQCSSNKECAVNLRCYNGYCRLATNPSSLSCSASTKPIISSTYASPSGTNDSKGASSSDTRTPDGTNRGTATSSPRASTSPSPRTQNSPQDSQDQDQVANSGTDSLGSTGPLAGVSTSLATLQAFFQERGLSLPLIALGAGAFFLIISLFSFLLGRTRHTSPPKGVAPIVSKRVPTAYETELQAKINELKQKTPSTSNVSVPPIPPTRLVTQKTVPPQPPKFKPLSATPLAESTSLTQNIPSTPATEITTASSRSGSSMLQKLHDRKLLNKMK